MNHSAAFQNFITAIDRDSDELAEQQATLLTAADEPDLLDLLAQTDENRQWWAVRALARCGTAAATPGLQATLHVQDAALRATAALALGHLYGRAPDTVRPLVAELAAKLTDDEGIVRQAVADALVMCGDDAVPALIAILRTQTQSGHEGARTRAAYALRKIATMKAAGALYHCLNDDNYLVRMYAQEGLEEMGLLENILVQPE
ncbi:MAG: HEAT repeat domain-containing protein [Chloroflexi bacterium]|nr:HEAT repeat domain-containing protein [Chloroflexota bacterium]